MVFRIFRRAALLVPLLFALPARAAEPPPSLTAPPPLGVIASIAPVHSLVGAVMAGAGEPRLLVAPGASPHTLALKPSEAAALRQADLVFWIGPGLETFLRRPLAGLAPGAQAIALSAAPLVRLLPLRGGEAWTDDDDDHGPEEKSGAALDMHFWLDPANARAMTQAIAAALAERDPGRAGLYRANAERSAAALESLERELQATLAPVAGRPFVVFHDAYQYLERRFGLNAVGAITAGSDRPSGASQTAALYARARTQGAGCVFAEPQFSPRAVAAVAEGIGARAGALDPLGQGLELGPGLYPAMMRGLAKSLVSCLGN